MAAAHLGSVHIRYLQERYYMKQEESQKQREKQEQARQLAAQVWNLSRDSILINMRFLDVAISGLSPVPKEGLGGVACDGTSVFYDPVFLLKKYMEEPACIIRLQLHVLMHCIFHHSYQAHVLEDKVWDLAADIAVEAAILELDLKQGSLNSDDSCRETLLFLKEKAGGLTAEKLYRFFKKCSPEEIRGLRLSDSFCRDMHLFWKEEERLELSRNQWEKISERVKTDLKAFSKGKHQSETMMKSLLEAAKERFDYENILRRFCVLGENARLNDEEFDYVYYTYGLSVYGNMPFVEPLEYKEEKKIKEFVIALDTSASCQGTVLKDFLKRTYSILRETESFFEKVNVHIVQCDSQIRGDVKITDSRDFETFLKKEPIRGLGTTDFRPVFTYIEELKQSGEFENLKGLIYFTDGYGVYPERMPDYEVIFAFPGGDENRPQIPPWAIRVIFEEQENKKDL